MSDLREARPPSSGSRTAAAGAIDQHGRLRLRRRRRGRTPRRVLAAVAVLLALAGGYSVVQLVAVRGDLMSVRDDLASGAGALAAGRAEDALERFDTAYRSARAAEDRLAGPVMGLAAATPLAGRTVTAARDISGAAVLVSRAGRELSGAAIALPEGVAALAPRDGRIPVRAIAAVAPALDDAHDLVAEASQRMAASPSGGLPGPVADARAELVLQLDMVEPQLETAAALSAALPAFLGADGPRRYFFAAQNPAELRGTGGFIGAYAILTVDDGGLEFSGFQSIVDLSPLPVGGVEPPSTEYRRLYGWAGGAGFGQNANMTPDVPSAAVALQRLYERVHGRPLDGAILADPEAFAALLRVAGPVEVEGLGSVGHDTIVELITNEAYALLPDSHARKELLGAVAAATLTGFLSEGASGSPAQAAETLVGVAAGGHLRFHANDPDVMEAFDVAGITGRLEAPHDLVAVVANNAAQNKVDFYTDRHVDHEVRLQPDGDALVETTVSLSNDAPTEGMPLDVIGPNLEGFDAGENRSLVSVYCGPGCRWQGSERGGTDVEPTLTGTELGFPLVATYERSAAGERTEVTHRFRTSGAWEPEEGRYRLRLLHQPTVRPTTMRVTVHSPDGLLVREASRGVGVTGDVATWTGELDRTRDVEVRLAPPARSAWQQLVDFLSRPAVTIGG